MPAVMQCTFKRTRYVSAKKGVPLLICTRAGCSNHHFGRDPSRARAVCKVPIVGAGDIVERAIKIVTFGLVRPGPKCKCRQRKIRLNKRWHWALPNWLTRWLGRAAPGPMQRPEIAAMIRVVD
jgi:hypothetical protein